LEDGRIPWKKDLYQNKIMGATPKKEWAKHLLVALKYFMFVKKRPKFLVYYEIKGICQPRFAEESIRENSPNHYIENSV